MPGGLRRVLYASLQVLLFLLLAGSFGPVGALTAHAAPLPQPTPVQVHSGRAHSAKRPSASPTEAPATAAPDPVAGTADTGMATAGSFGTAGVLATAFGVLLLLGRRRDRARQAASE